MNIDDYKSQITFSTNDSNFTFSKFDPSWDDIVCALHTGLVSLGYLSETAWEILLYAREVEPQRLTENLE